MALIFSKRTGRFLCRLSSRGLVNVEPMSLWRKKSLLCSSCRFPWYKYSRHGWGPATEAMLLSGPLGRTVHSQLSRAEAFSQVQPPERASGERCLLVFAWVEQVMHFCQPMQVRSRYLFLSTWCQEAHSIDRAHLYSSEKEKNVYIYACVRACV